ncbi:hypothetical protein [uncultured Croceicoccus sp.]|uniref:hypothetical protein n=1 Tax=uncultured Croceicoccus sp. TaxID=1295329 RepID=UPI002633FE17|nr:hypothetical protein [uncultured Croceicoccus sp.]
MPVSPAASIDLLPFSPRSRRIPPSRQAALTLSMSLKRLPRHFDQMFAAWQQEIL